MQIRLTKKRQCGVNLIEIMVAMVIGLFLVLGATTLYVNSKKTADVDDSIARLQETARYALSVIETDVRMANYWGATSIDASKSGASLENKDANNITITFGTGMGGTGAGTGTSLAVGTGGADCGDDFATRTEVYIDATNNSYGGATHGFTCAANSAAVTSADTLTIRRVAVNASPASSTQLQMCSNRSKLEITRNAAASCDGGEFHNLIANGYYVDQQSAQSNTYPSLHRWTSIDGPGYRDDEIVPGVEDMQIEFGWDDSNDGSTATATRYLQPENALLATGRIIAVRVWLLVRAEKKDFTFTDTRAYEYGDRAIANGASVNNLNSAGAATRAYRPNDNYRRLLVSRTFYIRNVTGI